MYPGGNIGEDVHGFGRIQGGKPAWEEGAVTQGVYGFHTGKSNLDFNPQIYSELSIACRTQLAAERGGFDSEARRAGKAGIKVYYIAHFATLY